MTGTSLNYHLESYDMPSDHVHSNPGTCDMPSDHVQSNPGTCDMPSGHMLPPIHETYNMPSGCIVLPALRTPGGYRSLRLM